jgi:hypothetical protein
MKIYIKQELTRTLNEQSRWKIEFTGIEFLRKSLTTKQAIELEETLTELFNNFENE